MNNNTKYYNQKGFEFVFTSKLQLFRYDQHKYEIGQGGYSYLNFRVFLRLKLVDEKISNNHVLKTVNFQKIDKFYETHPSLSSSICTGYSKQKCLKNGRTVNIISEI